MHCCLHESQYAHCYKHFYCKFSCSGLFCDTFLFTANRWVVCIFYSHRYCSDLNLNFNCCLLPVLHATPSELKWNGKKFAIISLASLQSVSISIIFYTILHFFVVLWDVTETWFFGEAMCKIVIYFQVIAFVNLL